MLELPTSLCVCRHCPRYMRLSLILPASTNVAPCVFASLARSLPAKSTMVSLLPPQGPAFLLRIRFLTSKQKKPWLLLDTLLLPVPATLRSRSPASSTMMASLRLVQTTLRRPATTLRSGDSSVDLKSSGRLRKSFVAADLDGGVRRS